MQGMNATQQTLDRVGDNLFRSQSSDIYYALFKVNGKQIRRSLKTMDRELAKRRLEELRRQVERLSVTESKSVPFAEYGSAGELLGGVAHRWLEIVGSTVEPSTRVRYAENIKQLAEHFGSLGVRNITLRHIEEWAGNRECAAETFNKERDVLVRVLEYAVDHGLLLDNPARKLKRRRGHKKMIYIPTKEQFRQLVADMRAVIRHADGNQSADLAELLAYSGCRKSEVGGDEKYGKPPMVWGDVNFELKVFTVTRSKNHESRTIPLFPSMEKFLLTLKERLPEPVKATDRIIPIQSGKTAIASACRRLGFPKFGHHTCRHFFCSNAIEAGVDFKVIAGWLGHKDGGILVAKTYGHLRDEHSAAMAKRMTFGVAELMQKRPSQSMAITCGEFVGHE